jgi:hypothetical protein
MPPPGFDQLLTAAPLHARPPALCTTIDQACTPWIPILLRSPPPACIYSSLPLRRRTETHTQPSGGPAAAPLPPWRARAQRAAAAGLMPACRPIAPPGRACAGGHCPRPHGRAGARAGRAAGATPRGPLSPCARSRTALEGLPPRPRHPRGAPCAPLGRRPRRQTRRTLRRRPHARPQRPATREAASPQRPSVPPGLSAL